jgi:hypothetical protein
MLCAKDGSRASFVIERPRIAIQPALGLPGPLSQKLRILEGTGFIVSDPNVAVTRRCCREALRPNVPTLPWWPLPVRWVFQFCNWSLVGRVSLASVRV